MYNRYMQKVQDVDDYIDLGHDPPGPIPDRPPHTPPFYTDAHRPPPEEMHHRPHFSDRDGEGILEKLLKNFHMPSFDLDDILLLVIVFLLLRDSGDEDLLLIFAALYFLGDD